MLPGPDSTGRPYKKRKKGTSSLTPQERRLAAENNRIHNAQIKQTNADLAAQRNGNKPGQKAGTGETRTSAQLKSSADAIKRMMQTRNLPGNIKGAKGSISAGTHKEASPKTRKDQSRARSVAVPVRKSGSGSRRISAGGNGPARAGGGNPRRALGKGKGGGKASSSGIGKLSVTRPVKGPSVGKTNAPTDQATAERSVDLQLNPQLNELARQLAAAQARLQQQSGTITQTRDNTVAGIGDVYAKLQGYQDANQQAGTNAWGAAKAGIDQSYANLQSQLQGTEQQRIADSNAELQRLGIASPGLDVNKIQRDSDFLQGLASVNQQAAGNGLLQQNANWNTVADLQQQGAQATGAQSKTQALMDALNGIITANNDYTGLKTDLEGKKSEIAGSRGAKVQEMLDIMRQNAFEQQMELGQQSFMNQLARDKFGLDQANLLGTQKDRQAQRKLDKQRLTLDQQKAAQDAANATADRTLKAAIARQQAEIAKYKAANGGADFKPTGVAGALEVIARGQPDKRQRQHLNTILRKIQTAGPNQGIDQTNYSGYSDQVQYGYKLLKKHGIDSSANRRLLADSLMAYYGKYGGS